MINTLVLCEGKNDLNFLRGMVENLGKDSNKIKFIEGRKDIIRIIRDGYYNTIIYSNGGKGDLPKYAKYLISLFATEKGHINIIYIKDRVAGNHIIENLFSVFEEFLSNAGKFPQNKPNMSLDGQKISVSFINVELTYIVIGIEVSLEFQVWKSIRDESSRTRKINRTYSDDHEKLKAYCSHSSMSMEELMKGTYDHFNEDDEWYMEIRALLDELL